MLHFLKSREGGNHQKPSSWQNSLFSQFVCDPDQGHLFSRGEDHEPVCHFNRAAQNVFFLVLSLRCQQVPPFVCQFSTRHLHGHLLAVADEDGCVSLLNTLKPAEDGMIIFGFHYRKGKERSTRERDRSWTRSFVQMMQSGEAEAIDAFACCDVCLLFLSVAADSRLRWQAHSNTIFALSWMDNDRKMVTGSADYTAIAWDVVEPAKLGVFHGKNGHSASIKGISVKPGNESLSRMHHSCRRFCMRLCCLLVCFCSCVCHRRSRWENCLLGPSLACGCPNFSSCCTFCCCTFLLFLCTADGRSELVRALCCHFSCAY